jgi:elongator complex protein 4
MKPWLNGQYMVSSGLRQLDTILGGGLVLGTALLLEEDVHSDHARTLLAYAMAEATSQGHKVLLVADMDERDIGQLIQSLPYNLSLNNEELPEAKAADQESAEAGSELKIAWQYQKYLSADTNPITQGTSQRPKVSVSENYCCSYDLARRMQPQLLEQHPITVISTCNEPAAVVLNRVREFLDANSGTVCQLVMPSIHRCDHVDADPVADRLRLFLAIKHLIRERMASCLVTIKPGEVSAQMLRYS